MSLVIKYDTDTVTLTLTLVTAWPYLAGITCIVTVSTTTIDNVYVHGWLFHARQSDIFVNI